MISMNKYDITLIAIGIVVKTIFITKIIGLLFPATVLGILGLVLVVYSTVIQPPIPTTA